MTRCVTAGDAPVIAVSRVGEEVFVRNPVTHRAAEEPPTTAVGRRTSRWRTLALALVAFVLMPRVAGAQGASPWENAVDVLRAAFTGPIARGLSLVAIVVGGLAFAYGEGQSKRMIAGIVFGVGMAIGAVNFMAWLFP
jgi:type IV secretion system protein TrbC